MSTQEKLADIEVKFTGGRWCGIRISDRQYLSVEMNADDARDVALARYDLFQQGEGGEVSNELFERAVGEAAAAADRDLEQAAPALYGALQGMLGDYEAQYGEDFCECDDSVNVTCSACHARSALAQAEGERAESLTDTQKRASMIGARLTEDFKREIAGGTE